MMTPFQRFANLMVKPLHESLSHVARQGLAPLWGRHYRLPTHSFPASDGHGSDLTPTASGGLEIRDRICETEREGTDASELFV
jgi:hypothetical protein